MYQCAEGILFAVVSYHRNYLILAAATDTIDGDIDDSRPCVSDIASSSSSSSSSSSYSIIIDNCFRFTSRLQEEEELNPSLLEFR